MILAPFVHKNLSLLDVCYYHLEGYVFMTRGLNYLKIQNKTVLHVHVDLDTNLAPFCDTFFKMCQQVSKKAPTSGLLLATSRTSDYLQASSSKQGQERGGFQCATLSTLSSTISGSAPSSVLCMTTDKHLYELLGALEDDALYYNLRKPFKDRTFVILEKTKVAEDFQWQQEKIIMYDPRKSPL